ncbi:hypothetical protein K491DRAFT_587915 [Lophiostoma macrostomum CBS 122681]|uniref:Small secreted protein n=1 Tax=Lophiostoma macrostomum CBS 122681 TaxID=1314788 RepID=A0A6A6TQ53_9PLEO|nr:hypothetical protein K491DRAFT_587915 [Lophiostoma macrostomum CBS 122681]
MKPFLSLLLSTIALWPTQTISQATAPQFNITALTTVNNASRLECWTLPSTPQFAAGATSYEIGNFSNSFIGILPARTYSNATITHPRQVQFTIALSGLIHIRTPTSGLPETYNEAWVHGGKYGFLIAADTVESGSVQGHETEFPSDQPTWLAEFPTVGGLVPEHILLHVGPCGLGDLIGV